MLLILGIYIGTGLFMALLAIPMIRGWINPNPYYGLRVKQTLEDPALWFPVNRYAGWCLFFAGIFIAAGSAVSFLLPGQSLASFSFCCLGITFVALIWAIVSSFRYLHRLIAKS
jgi:uncharacterized membrane protein